MIATRDIATAAGYLRRSTDRQEQSLPDQRKAIERYAEEHGYRVATWYTDDGISGGSADARDAFLRMIDDARKPDRPFRWVIVYDVKRFGRLDNDETGYYRHLLAQSGVEVLYASENFSGDDTDDLLRPVKQWQARQELKDLSKVTIRGLLTKSEGGWWMGGMPPYGYDLCYVDRSGRFLMTVRYMPGCAKQVLDERGRVTRTLDPSDHLTFSKEDRAKLVLSAPERVKVVRRIFEWYTSHGLGFKTIADRLNREGVPSPGRKAGFKGWAMGTIRELLMNPAYTGDMTWNRRSMAKFHGIQQRRAVPRPKVQDRAVEENGEADWIVTKDSHPPVVSRQVFELAKTKRTERRSRYEECYRSGRGAKSDYLLSGLVFCKRCGHRWQGCKQTASTRRTDGSKIVTRYYGCGGYITKGKSVCQRSVVRQELLEGFLLDEIGRNLKVFLDGDAGHKVLEKALRGVCGTRSDNGKESERLLARQAEIEQKVFNILDNVTATTREFADKRVGQLKAELNRVAARLEELNTLAAGTADIGTLVNEMIGYLAGLQALAASGTVEEKRLFVRAFTHRIELDPENGTGRAELYQLPKAMALPAKTDSATNLLYPLVAGVGFEPTTSGL